MIKSTTYNPTKRKDYYIDAITKLRLLPWCNLPRSALVDFILFLTCNKPAVRLKIVMEAGIAALANWCQKAGFDLVYDEDNFVCIADNSGIASNIIQIDRSYFPHEVELGLALGYPICCCERIAAIGESEIDHFAVKLSSWVFTGPYTRINPSGYKDGLALISHLPCSPVCDNSLLIANQAYEFVIANKEEPVLSRLCHSSLMSVESGQDKALA